MDYHTQRRNIQKRLDDAEMSRASSLGRQADELTLAAVAYWDKEIARLNKRLSKVTAEEAAFRAKVAAVLGRAAQ